MCGGLFALREDGFVQNLCTQYPEGGLYTVRTVLSVCKGSTPFLLDEQSIFTF